MNATRDGDVSCWKCGHQYPLQRKFCIKCGSKPTRPGSGAASGATPAARPSPAPTPTSAPTPTHPSATSPSTKPHPQPTPRTQPGPAAGQQPAPPATPAPAPQPSHFASPAPHTATTPKATPAPYPTPSPSVSPTTGDEPGEGPCAECGAELSGTVVTDASGRSYHSACFRCCRCGRSLTESYHVVQEGGRDRFYCREDYIAANSPSCATCGKPITAEGAEDHTGAKHHLACFACKRCGTPISGKYIVDSKGDLCCGHCSGNATNDSTPAEPAGGRSQPSDGNAFRCGTCGGELEGQVVGVGDVRYHKQCFVCPLCRCDLTSQPFHLENGQLRCKKCLLLERGDVCAACGQVIEEGALQAMTKLWHEACFKCGDCNQTIGAGHSYAAKGETPICASCAAKY